MKIKLMGLWRPDPDKWILPVDGMDLEEMTKLRSYLFQHLPFPTPARGSILTGFDIEDSEEISSGNEQFDLYHAAREAQAFLVIGIPVDED